MSPGSLRRLCAQAALILFAGATLHAQTMVPVSDFPPPFPAQHSYIIGLVASPAAVGLDINVVTTAELYRARFYSGSSLAFAKYLDASTDVNLDEASLAVPIPDKLLYTSLVAFQVSLSSLEIATGVATSFPFDVVDYPTGFAVDSSGAMYLYTTDGVARYANVTAGTRSLTMGGSGSGAGQLSIPGGALAVGPGGVLYAFDRGNNRVVRFDTTTGTYLGNIPLIGTNASTALVVSPSGRVYTANGNGGGSVYDALTGALIETFSSSVANPDLSGLGNADLFLDGRGFLYLYDVATGMHVFSDPASVAAGADLGVTISGPGSITAGTNISYDVKITKNGASDAINATLSDVLPAGTTFVSATQTSGPAFTCTKPAVGATGSVSCMIATFPALTSATFTIVLNVNANIADGLLITNTASASSAAPDPTPGNDSASTPAATVSTSADLAVTKSGPAAIVAGNNITYTVTATNNGPSDAQSVTLNDTLPAGTSFVSLSNPGSWSCTAPAVGAGGNVSCSNTSVPIGNSVFTLTVAVGANLIDGTVITNTATASSATFDPNSSNDNGTATTTVGIGSADLSVTKTGTPDPVTAGTNLTYTITVNNAGPSNATTAVLSDTLPSGTTFVALVSPSGWSCTTPAVGAGGTVSCSSTSMAAGNAVFTLTVAVSSTAAAGSELINIATVTSVSGDPNPGNQSSTATTDVISPATLSATNTASGMFSPGSTVAYTIVISNAGPAGQSDNLGDEIVDVLPPELTLISATATSGTAVATVGTNTVTWNGAIPAGGSVTITIQALIEANAAVGSTIINQATIHYDADGDGTNEAMNVSDDPSQAGSGNSTGFVVASAHLGDIPALDGIGLAALAALLAGVGLLVMRRS